MAESTGGKIDKVKRIANAFINPLPEGEYYYESRLETCNGCEYNSKNISDEQKQNRSFLEKIAGGIKEQICDSGNHCTACGCCIERKCSDKQSECGLAEIGKAPKWKAIEVKSPVDSNVSIINITPDGGTTYKETNSFAYDLGEVSDGKISFKFQIKRRGGFNVKTYMAVCSCTVGSMTVIDKDTVEFDMSISSLKFHPGVTTRKTFKVVYYERPNVEKEVSIVIKAIKKNGTR